MANCSCGSPYCFDSSKLSVPVNWAGKVQPVVIVECSDPLCNAERTVVPGCYSVGDVKSEGYIVLSVTCDAETGDLTTTTTILSSDGVVVEDAVSIPCETVGVATSSMETVLDANPGDTALYTIDVPLNGARGFGIYVDNQTGVSVTVSVQMYSGITASTVYSELIAAGTERVVMPGATGVGADGQYIEVPSLGFPTFPTIGVSYQCSGAPTGNLRIDVGRIS